MSFNLFRDWTTCSAHARISPEDEAIVLFLSNPLITSLASATNFFRPLDFLAAGTKQVLVFIEAEQFLVERNQLKEIFGLFIPLHCHQWLRYNKNIFKSKYALKMETYTKLTDRRNDFV